MKMLSWIISIFFLFATQSVLANITFVPSEHHILGNKIHLQFPDGTVQNPQLHLANSMQVSYGDIISLGDFYGVLGSPISKGKTTTSQQSRFIMAFNAFAAKTNTVSETQQILDVTRKAVNDVLAAMARGEKPETFYAKNEKENAKQYNCITGGGCHDGWWLIPGRALKLAEENFDHFGNNAIIAYEAGHQAALIKAINAGKTHDRQQLEIAYAMNAFASHFLTDRFSAGHIRTPRNELSDEVSPSVAGSALSNYMHNEESANGLHVYNLHGDKWIAFGDQSYFNPKNEQNHLFTELAMQQSADEIFSAYTFQIIPPSSVLQLIPYAFELNNHAASDISTMFYWDSASKKLFRRSNLANFYDRHWTADWWGWSTLSELSKDRGLPHAAQIAIARSQYAKQAVIDGIISDDEIRAFIIG